MEHIILGLMLTICIYLLIVGLRIAATVERESSKTLALAEASLDAISKVLQRK